MTFLLILLLRHCVFANYNYNKNILHTETHEQITLISNKHSNRNHLETKKASNRNPQKQRLLLYKFTNHKTKFQACCCVSYGNLILYLWKISKNRLDKKLENIIYRIKAYFIY